MSLSSISGSVSRLTPRFYDADPNIRRAVPMAAFEIESPNDSPSLQNRANIDPPSAAKRVKQAGKLFFCKAAVVVWTALCFVLTLSATLWMRVYSYYKHKSFAEDLEKAQIKSVSDSLNIVLAGPHRGERTHAPADVSVESLKEGLLLAYRVNTGFVAGTETKSESEKLAVQVLEIRKKIERMAQGEIVPGGIAELREDLSAVMNTPLYQLLEREDCEAVNFVQFASVKLIATDGNEALRKYGKKCLGELRDEETGVVQLADHMTGYLNQLSFAYGFPHRALFIACHPLTAFHSATSAMDPLNYNASEGNPNFSAHAFSVDGKKLQFYYGPGPTGNPIFEHGVIPAYKKFGVFELRFNHQDMGKKSESHRVKEILRMGEENPDVLRHVLLGFDTKIRNNKNTQFHDADSFFAAYRAYLKNGLRGQMSQKNHSGIEIPEHLLSDAEADVAINQAQEFCNRLSANNPHWEETLKKKGPKGFLNHLRYAKGHLSGRKEETYHLTYPGKARMAKMMQLITDTYLGLAVIYRTFDAITPEMVERTLNEKLDKDLTSMRTSSACKQNIDRALVENISLRLFFRWTHNPAPLTQEEVYEIVGAVFGRARLVDDRNIMSNRYRILDDLLRFIGHAQGGVDTAHALLKGYRQALKPPTPFKQKIARFFS